MIIDIVSGILACLFGVGCIALVSWFFIYSTQSSIAKRNKDLESELTNLKIVNSNLAKYNQTLLDNLKK